MKTAADIPLTYVQTPGTKLLVGRVVQPIPADAYLVFRRDGDRYRLQVVEQSGDHSDPVTLASFLAPADIDAAEALTAAQLSLESTKRKRKPRTRRSAAKG